MEYRYDMNDMSYEYRYDRSDRNGCCNACMLHGLFIRRSIRISMLSAANKKQKTEPHPKVRKGFKDSHLLTYGLMNCESCHAEGYGSFTLKVTGPSVLEF